MLKKYVIAIDGPAGVGKTSTSKLVAGKLGYIYVNTGAIYRAIAWKSLQDKIDTSDTKRIKGMMKNLKLEIKPKKNVMGIWIDGKDITGRLRGRKVTERSSIIAAMRLVREHLIGIQQKVGARGGVVMEGRDIGTVIFPDTPYKFFLKASIDTRAGRRYLELKKNGKAVGLARIKRDIMTRDRRDRTRKINPLRKAKDAVVIDSTNMKIKDVVKCILNRIA